MSWSFAIGSYKGTVVRVHVTLLILLAWIAMSYYVLGGPRVALSGLILVVLIFACVTAHEFGHVLVARRYGVRTPEIVLLPIGGASRLEEIPERPKQEAIVGLAGPLVSLAIAGVLIAVLGRFPTVEDLAPERLADRIIPVPQLAFINLALAAFNLLPAFPMDGGRVLRAALTTRMGRLRATRAAARIGQGFAILFGVVGLMTGNIILALVAVFVFFAASAESGSVRLEEAARGLAASDAMITRFEALAIDATMAEAADALIRTTQDEFPVVDAGGRFRGMLTRDDLVAALREHGRAAPVIEAMQTDVPTVSRAHALERILPRLRDRTSTVAVLDPAGRLLGYITLQNLTEKMMIAEAPGAH